MGAVVVRRRDNDDIVQAFASGVWQRVYNLPDQLDLRGLY